MKNFLEKIEFPEYVKDNKVNASNVLINNEKILNDEQVAGIILAIFYVKNEMKLVDLFEKEIKEIISEDMIFGSKAAANIMNMNNIYYRGKHYLGNDYKDQQAKLRMTIYAKHKISKIDFELISLAVSFINGCEYCVQSHAKMLENDGVSKEVIHESLRIASIFNTIREKY